jgi:predicted transcriptional regulator
MIGEFPKVMMTRLSDTQKVQLAAMAERLEITPSAVVRLALEELWNQVESDRLDKESAMGAAWP